MKAILRSVVMMLALIAFFGLGMAHVMPAQAASTSDCAMNCAQMAAQSHASMPNMAAPAKSPCQKTVPCQDMSKDCGCQLGCMTTVTSLPADFGAVRLIAYQSVTFVHPDLNREGLGTYPLYNPPKQQA